MTDAIASAAEAAARLESVFDAIHRERMTGIPILNPALRVEAVALRPWEGHWVGALVTPWFMNLVVLPGGGAWCGVRDRESVWYEFPSGRFEFIAGSEPGVGAFHACSLFSPVLEFGDHETAREVARLAVESLFDPAMLGESHEERAVSRRDFLRGGGPARP